MGENINAKQYLGEIPVSEGKFGVLKANTDNIFIIIGDNSSSIEDMIKTIEDCISEKLICSPQQTKRELIAKFGQFQGERF